MINNYLSSREMGKFELLTLLFLFWTGLAGCYLYKDNMDNYTRSKFNKTSDYNYTNDIPTNASFLYCVKECRKNNKTYAGIMTTPQVLVLLIGIFGCILQLIGQYIDYFLLQRNCFCGNEYNQTFAKDLKECSIASNSYMTIYNTGKITLSKYFRLSRNLNSLCTGLNLFFPFKSKTSSWNLCWPCQEMDLISSTSGTLRNTRESL